MLAFWPSDAVLVCTQAALVTGPRPRLPRPLLRLRNGFWGWLLLPISLGGTILLLALVPSLGIVYAWVAQIGVPILAAIAIACLVPLSWVARAAIGTVGAGLLFAWAWWHVNGLDGQGAAVALTALSACALGSYLGQLAPRRVLQWGLIAMATLDAILVFGQLLEGPNNTLNAATPGHALPHLQFVLFGSVLMGYGDLFVAAVLGNILDDVVRRRWVAALVVLACSAVFDMLFFVVDALPATVPIAVAMLLVEGWALVRRRRLSAP